VGELVDVPHDRRRLRGWLGLAGHSAQVSGGGSRRAMGTVSSLAMVAVMAPCRAPVPRKNAKCFRRRRRVVPPRESIRLW
jgi:hypothetical protein